MRSQLSSLHNQAFLNTLLFLIPLPIMLRKLVAALAWIPLLATPGKLKAQVAKEAPSLVAFPDVGVAILQPSGFEKAESFYGFQQPSTGASVMVLAIPGPFAEVTQGFTKPALAEKGMTLHSKELTQVKGQSGVKVYFSQQANGQEFLKWAVLFGDTERTKMVVATAPKTHASKLRHSLQTVLQSVEPSQMAAAPLPFEIEAVADLAQVQGVAMGNTALFTLNGTIPTATPNDPMFIVALSIGEVFVGNRKEYARRRLLETAQTEIESVQTTTPITIDELEGYELTATGKDQKSQTPLMLYQVMLFPDEGGYILMMGMVGQQQVKNYLPQFKAMAQTFQQSLN
ncbi:hypothetical protein [Acaryochloris sp. CCMEE 5410]|uniref:hypothetical protein n=1 Tax=Acaryochloris sp. CCMEE 5410 TaxID=310037 RepID=UPI000248450D|nr:hypothetical protein [Acaryochloris sp. CCMEE 5410]KAI9130569.1 hypothetical protein ON05_022555 [Acaryochloris sp. CCMEE 5410]